MFLFTTSRFDGELIGETREGKVFWVKIEDLDHMALASNTHEYLNVLQNDSIFEAFITYNRLILPNVPSC